MRPVAFGAGLAVALAAVDGLGDAVPVAPPHAATKAVAPASFRNPRRSSSGVIEPLPRLLAWILRAPRPHHWTSFHTSGSIALASPPISEKSRAARRSSRSASSLLP